MNRRLKIHTDDEQPEGTALEQARALVAENPTWASDVFAALRGTNGADDASAWRERVETETTRPPVMEGTRLSVALDYLSECPFNPRKTFGAMASLADSLKRIGVVQPLLVRPATVGPAGRRFEVICGHRRLRAAREAGLAVVPCEVRELDDAQALEAMLSENGQRENLTHLEQAETFDALRLRGWSVEQIAARLSTTPGTVYGRLQLLHLCPEAKQAVADGRLPGSVAVPLARLPSQASQAKALDVLFERFAVEGVIQARDAIAWIQRDFTRPLREAPFSLTDESLAPPAPACNACPKNTKTATPGLFDDFRETRHPVCTDTACFKAKASASWERKAEAAKRKGQVVLSPADGARLFGLDNVLAFGSRYVEASQPNHDDPKKRTWQELADRCEGTPPAVFAPDRTLRGHVLFERGPLVTCIAASLGLAWAKREVESATPAQSEPKTKAKVDPAVAQAEREASERRARIVDGVLVKIGAAVAKRGVTAADWRALALALMQRSFSTDVLTALGVDSAEQLRERVSGQDASWAIRVLFLVLLRDSDLADGDLDAGDVVPAALRTFAKLHGVTPDDVAFSLDAERLFEKRKAKGKAS